MSDDKTEEPTQHRLREARKKGQVSKSNDLVGALVILASFYLYSATAKTILYGMADSMKGDMLNLRPDLINPENIRGILLQALKTPSIVLLPLFALAIVTGVLGNYLQVGWLISTESLNFKLDKLNPVEGAKKVFSAKGFMEFVKALIRTLLFIIVFRSFLIQNIPEIINAQKLHTPNIIDMYVKTSFSLIGKLTFVLILTGALDYILQRYQFMKDMKMTKQEIKDEFKSVEGDPFMKSRMRSKQREFIKKRMLDGVKDSRVIITNPTHIAVALKFKEEEDEVPVVVAKGKDHLAVLIKNLGEKFEIRRVENKPLAWMLYDNVEIGEVIPPDMYQAVAEVIAFVEKLEQGLEEPEGEDDPG